MLNPIRCGVYLCTVILLLLLICAVAGCGGGSGSTNDPKEGQGGLGFRLAWGTGSSKGKFTQPAELVSGDVCADYLIDWIHIQAIDQSGSEQRTAMWPCKQRQGVLTEVPVGIYRLNIQGEVAGEMAWSGEIAGVQVQKDQQTDAGVVVMTHLHDHTAPAVVQTIPADNATQVPVNQSLTATFDDFIVAQSISTENFKLSHTDANGVEHQVDCTVSYDAVNHIAVLSPSQSMLNDTNYVATIVVDAGLVVEDIAGNPMQTAVQWTFTTFLPDTEAPQIQSFDPVHGQMEVAVDASVKIEFSEPINPFTISTESIYLQCEGLPVAATVSYEGHDGTATLSPDGSLPAGTTCTMTATNGIADLAGNLMADTESWSFVTRFGPWHTGPVHGYKSSWSTSIALGSQEAPYISYRELEEVKLAVRGSDGTWSPRTIGSVGGSGKNHDMVLGKDDRLHIVYYDEEATALRYYYECLPGCGAFATFIENGIACEGVAIATNDAEPHEAHVCYFNATNAQLQYASSDTNWEPEVIDTGNGQYPAIAVTETGVLHIVYSDQANEYLNYISKAPGGSWTGDIIDAGVKVGFYTDIALDSSDRPHVSYFDQDAGDLKYAVLLASGDWSVETVDSDGITGRYTGIALDSSNRAHISYNDFDNKALKYATKTALGIWYRKIIDDTGASGADTAIIIDSQDHVHISHTDMLSGGQIRYTTTRPQN